jgi:ABC-type Co2+ transport system permease subunit
MGGYVAAALLAFWGSWRIRDEEIPRIALLSAAFTVASAFHVSVGLGTSVHLILNGLVGAVLGRRAALAIPVGLFLQAVAGHGGFTTLGINTCIMLMPALLAGLVVRNAAIRDCCRLPVIRSLQIGVSAFLWILCVMFGVALFLSHAPDLQTWATIFEWARPWLIPALGLALAVALLAVIAERWRQAPPEFALGYLIGQFAVLLSVALSALVMLLGGPRNEGAYLFAFIFFVAHLPLAVVEGVVLGFLLAYLVRVKPELLQPIAIEQARHSDSTELQPQIAIQSRGVEECPADTLS